MRILVFSDLYPPVAIGGYELDCQSFVDGLRGRHEILVLTSTLRRGEAPDEAHVRRELPWAGHGRIRDTAAAGLTALRAARVVRRAVADFQPDLVYVSNCVSVPQAAPATAMAMGLPMAYRLSETFFATELYWGDRFLRHLRPGDRGARAVWAAAMRLVNRHPALRLDPTRPSRAAVSWASRDLSQRAPLPTGMEAALERVIYPASKQSELFAQIERHPFDQPTAVYLGRVTINKGAEVAVRAVARVRDEHGVPVRLVVAGSVDETTRAQLEAVAAETGMGDALELLGRTETDQIAAVLAGAHALLVPSLVPDVFPLVCIEGALARVPIVASRTGGIPEALEDGAEALLAPPGDVDAFADAMWRTIDDPDAAAERARRAYERMSALTPERYVAESEAFAADALSALRPK
ncbi:MAG TPA: glycosyltransferase [Thermoleophilaceae bacterium]|nr:glycosyltransferase [Thermoleophilaceae bacterium]